MCSRSTITCDCVHFCSRAGRVELNLSYDHIPDAPHEVWSLEGAVFRQNEDIDTTNVEGGLVVLGPVRAPVVRG